MKVEATREDIRVLLELIELHASAEPVMSAAAARARDAAERRLPDEILTRYRHLTAAGRHPVIVAVEREACSGCHVRLATMVVDRVKHSIGIYVCPRCQRMLYAPEIRSAPPGGDVVEKRPRARRRPRQTSAHHS
jgi:predicted  nucleic acid-binding Zn-ribbon protein